MRRHQLDQKLKKWIRWLDSIKMDIQKLIDYRHIFWEVQKIIRENNVDREPSSFFSYIGDTYVAYSIMAIRRQIKIDSDSISLSRLLTEVIEYPQLISRDFYKTLYEGSNVEDLADEEFNRFCDKNGEFISKRMVENDYSNLKSIVRTCEDFADKRIAHTDIRQINQLPKFEDLDKSVNELDQLYVKYHLIFHAESMQSLMPTYQYTWTKIFEYAWIKK